MQEPIPLPQGVVDAANLARIVCEIESSRFAPSPDEQEESAPAQLSGFERLLTAAGMPPQIKAAMEEAESCLRGTGQFDTKHAADLIRACMDETHRSIVAELEKATGKKFQRADKDGARRAYMSSVGFINKDEEIFISAVYTLISREGAHKLSAPRETILVMHRTVKDFLLLLLRRLAGRKSSPPPPP